MKFFTEAVSVPSHNIIVRRRLCFGVAIFLLALAGIGIRANSENWPAFIVLYAPDVLWAMLVFALIAFFAPRLKTWQVALIALCFAFLIELSQLYQTPWLNSVRATRVGGLVLGFGFLWSDLICYTTGIMFVAFADSAIRFLDQNRKVN